MWLEDTLFKILIKNKKISDKQLKIKLKKADIEYVDEYVQYLLDINEENKIRFTIEFLDSYPVSLQAAGLYEDEIQKVNKWEIGVIAKLFIRLEKEYKYITDKIYTDFFNEVMQKYKPYFLDETYNKILPENVFRYWCYRIDTDILWIESGNDNIAINLTALIESKYLNIDKSIYNYEKNQNDVNC